MLGSMSLIWISSALYDRTGRERIFAVADIDRPASIADAVRERALMEPLLAGA